MSRAPTAERQAPAGALASRGRSAPDTSPVEVAALRLVLLNADVLFPAS